MTMLEKPIHAIEELNISTLDKQFLMEYITKESNEFITPDEVLEVIVDTARNLAMTEGKELKDIMPVMLKGVSLVM